MKSEGDACASPILFQKLRGRLRAPHSVPRNYFFFEVFFAAFFVAFFAAFFVAIAILPLSL